MPAKGHNNLAPKDMERVRKFLKGLGPYQSDVWSNSYYSEILDHLKEEDAALSQAAKARAIEQPGILRRLR